jgi:microcystin synthetase protein McyJ
MNQDQKDWHQGTQEKGVEKFYATAITGFHDYHGGYLNFGYWDQPGISYETAAENLINLLGRKLGLDSSSHLLDVGCGMGSQDVYLTKTFTPAKIDALDVTWKHIEIARERATRAQIDPTRLEFHHGTAVSLPFAPQSFSQLLSVEAPEHFNTREDFFKEAYRVLQPGGVMVLADYTLAKNPNNIFKKIFLSFARSIWHVPVANVYDNDVYKEKLLAQGFRQVTIENVGRLTIPGYYFEHRKWEQMKKMRRLRGFWKGVVGGFLIDFGVYQAYKLRICEYALVRAEK